MKRKGKVTLFTIIALCSLFLFTTAKCVPPWRKAILKTDLHDVDLPRVNDGTYTGEHEYRDYIYKVQAEVIDHRITDIEIVDWKENEARGKALAIFDRVIERQSLCVDAISGATTASRLYLLCLADAFPYIKDEKCDDWE